MPLRDHFHPPVSDFISWDALHGAWPTTIAFDLNRRLPPRYVASPRIHLGADFEIDVATTQTIRPSSLTDGIDDAGGGVATARWAPPAPSLTVETDWPQQDEYEVRIFDGRRLVGAVEVVSPSNKDRAEHRRTFVAKCATLLQQGVSVSIIDPVTARHANLYAELLDLLGQHDASLPPEPSALYAVTCRLRETADSWLLEAWPERLAVGEPLPTLPLWLDVDLAVPLELESTYEETCRGLRIR